MSDQKPQEGYTFKTPFGLKEEVFMRTVAKGNYSPVIHEFEDLILRKVVTYNEYRILVFIKSKTVNFRNTHVRLRRKDIQGQLGMTQAKTYLALKSLVEKKLILEKADIDNYFFYALDPATFGGIIVLRSISEAPYRLNVAEKRQKGTLPKWNTKKELTQYQKGIDLMSNWYREDESIIRNYSGFDFLKYTLLKYILLNGISAGYSQETLKLLEGTQNPEFMIKQFSSLIQKNPSYSRGIIEELLRANRQGTDGQGRPIQKNAVAYVITSWDTVRHHWHNLDHKIDMSPEAVLRRSQIFAVIQEYPIASNVIPLKKSN
jgi:hypothetical protein